MEENWYYVESDDHQPYYVKGESEVHVMRLVERHAGSGTGLNIEQVDSFEYDDLDTPEPPFRSLEEGDATTLLMHEKRVNQAGSKGIYQVMLDE